MGYIQRLTSYPLRHRRLFVGFLAAAGIGTIFNVMTPKVLSVIIDDVIPTGNFTLLAAYAGLYLGLLAFFMIFDILGRYGAVLSAQQAIYELRKDLYESLMDKDLTFFDMNESGQLIARVTTDVTTMREFLVWGYRVIFIGIATLIGTYVMMWSISPTLTIYMFGALPIIVLFGVAFAKHVRPVFYRSREKYGELSSVLAENIVGIKVVKSYSASKRESQRVERHNEEFRRVVTRAYRLAALYQPLLPALLGVVTGALIYFGGNAVIKGTLTDGEFVAFVALIGMLILPARFLSWGIGMYQRASAAGERTFFILDHKDMIVDAPDAIETDKIDGTVEFDKVSFGYNEDNTILNNVSFKVRAGQVVALLGGTGSGKSSLVNLIPRLYDVTSGRVLVDGIDVRSYKIRNLRKNIAMVHQEPFLFSTTVRENIAFAKPEATDEEVEEAARAAMIHDFITALPEGYDSIVGERGVSLSGGQRQRIAIARAILADPRILILDDSTSSVDAKTELMIQQALENLIHNRTTFIITHRMSTIRNADLIVVMERGKVVEIGSHEELIALGGIYADIHNTLSSMELTAKKDIEQQEGVA
ncbi:MAG: ABC transporter ATP-binding protein [Candidatus Thorarchaeota archaeon]